MTPLRHVDQGLAIPGEAFLEDHDPLELALPFSYQQSAAFHANAVSGLGGPTVERSGAILFLVRTKHPLDRPVETAEGVRLQAIGEYSHQQPAREMERRFAAQMGAPLAAQPTEIMAIKAGTIERTEASSGSEASSVVFADNLAACRELPGFGAIPITPLDGSPPAYALGRDLFRRFRLDDQAISAIHSRAADSVHRISSVDPFTGDDISAVAQPGQRRPRRVRQPSCRLRHMQDRRAIGPLEQVDDLRELAAGPRRERLSVFTDETRPRGFVRLRLRGRPWRDRLLRAVVDRDGFQLRPSSA